MAVIDAALVFMNGTAAGASVTSDVCDLGANGSLVHQIYVSVKLTEGVTAGAVESVKVQTATDSSFTSPVDEMEVFVKADATKQKKPCTLAQFYCPLEPSARYVRLVVTGSTTGDSGGTAIAGGKLWAYISPDVQVPI